MGLFLERRLKYTMAGLWKWKLFVTFLTLSILFSICYYTPLFTHLLQSIDSTVFQKIHLLTHKSSYIQTFLLLASHPHSHTLFFILGIGFWLINVKNHPKHLQIHKLSEIVYSIAVLFFTVFFINKLLLQNSLHFERLGPKFTNPISQLLQEVTNFIHRKKTISHTYPGYFSTIVVGYMCISMIDLGFRKGLIAFIGSLYFLLPALFLGTYGICDLVLGTTSVMFMSIAIFFYTPIYYRMTSALTHLIEKLLKTHQKSA